jgi:hypothetical protein
MAARIIFWKITAGGVKPALVGLVKCGEDRN